MIHKTRKSFFLKQWVPDYFIFVNTTVFHL